MKNKKIPIALTLLMFSGLLLADELDVLQLKSRQQAIDLFLQSEAKAQSAPLLKAKPADCLGSVLPTVPKQPSFTVTSFKFIPFATDSASLTFWREPCTNGKDTVLLVRATPKVGTPFICSSSFSVVQNGNQYGVKIADGLNSSFCGDLIVSKTLFFDQYSSGEQFNPANALTIYADSKKLLDVPLKGIIKPAVTDINGTVNGYKNFSHTCKNITTGAVKSFPTQTTPAFHCTGLAMKKGHKIQTVITGIAN